MKPIATADTPDVFKLPGGTEENDLPCRRENGKVTSYWQVDDDAELARLLRDGRLVLWTYWPNVIGVNVEVGDDEFTEMGATVDAHLNDDDEPVAYSYVVLLSDAALRHLMHGGRVKLTIDMDPTCAVAMGPFETAETA